MNKSVGRIAFIVGLLVIVYFCLSMIGTVVQLADAADRIHAGSGQAVFWILGGGITLLGLSPLYLYRWLPASSVNP